MRTLTYLLSGLLLSACGLTGLGPGNTSTLAPDDAGRLNLSRPGFSQPVLSADGQALAFLRVANDTQQSVKPASGLYVLDLTKNAGKRIGQVNPSYYDIAWVHENRSLFLTGSSLTYPEYGGRESLWHKPSLVNLDTGAQRELSSEPDQGQQIPLSRPGQQSFYLTQGQAFRLISLNAPDKTLPLGQDRLLAYRLAGDGKLNLISQKATDPEDKLTISRLDPDSGQVETLFQLQGPVTSAAAIFSPDGQRAIVKTANAKRLILLNLSTKEHQFIESQVAISELSWSPNSQHLVLEGPADLYLYSLMQPGFRRLAPVSPLSDTWNWNSDSQQVLVLSKHRKLTAHRLDGSSSLLAELPADSKLEFSDWIQLADGWLALKVQNPDVSSKDAPEIRLLQPGSDKAESLKQDCQESASFQIARAEWRTPALAPGLAWHCPTSGISVWKPETGLKQYRDLVLTPSE